MRVVDTPTEAAAAAAAVVEADVDLADAAAAVAFESVLDRLGGGATAALEESSGIVKEDA